MNSIKLKAEELDIKVGYVRDGLDALSTAVGEGASAGTYQGLIDLLFFTACDLKQQSIELQGLINESEVCV